MENKPLELSLEQQFAIKRFNDQVMQMNVDQAREFAILLNKQLVVQNALFAAIIKKEWGIGEKP